MVAHLLPDLEQRLHTNTDAEQRRSTMGNVFYGLIQNRFGFASNNATNGSLTAALVTGTGNFSGKVFLNGQTTSFTGLALGDGDVWFRAPDKSLHRELAVGDAQLTGYFESGNFHMFVSNGSDLMGGAAQPAEYSKTNLVPADLLNRAAVSGGSLDQGFYTVALPAKEQSTDKPLTDYPQGSGYASLTLKNNGTLRLAGVLADGTRFTAASALVAEGESPVHAQLPTPATTTREKGGSLLGTLSFAPNQDDSDVSGYDLLWFRPAVTEQSGTTTAAKATQVYTEGWEDGIEVDLIGAFYDKTATAEATLGFSAGNAGLLSFSEGKLATPVEVSNFSLTGNTATKSPTTDRSFSLSFTQSAGLMRGTFTPGWTSTKLPAFQGVLLGKGANRGGHGFFLSNQTGDLDPESGAVTLDQP